ncbi:unnamed protein product [Dovyalis caffra]|uniref:Uncharacterized protein n=1 Tax=Dovyalis caffra TaxID=77055 RepID=A0AAV1STF8_9ROSI|nr:unnamed protein product [Dovyalis caffra]
MEIKEQNQKRSDENCIKAPAPDAGTPGPCEMVVENPGHDPKAREELHNLAICDELFPLGTLPYCTQKVVEVHYDMHRRVYDKHSRKQRLRSVQRYITHDHNRCMVVHVEERQPSDGVAQDDQEGVHEFKNLRQVENIGPEEEGPFWLGVFWVTNDVLHIRCVQNNGEGATDGHGEGKSEEDNVMNGCEEFEDSRAKRRNGDDM